jgi:Schlafen, AlbA_2
MIHQFTHLLSKPRYWIDRDQGRGELIRQEMRRVEIALDEFAKLESNLSNLPTRQERVAAILKTLGIAPVTQADICIAPDAPRLAFRDVARNTDERTLIATILPPEVFASNTLNYLSPWYFNAEEIFEHTSSVRECYEPTFPTKIQSEIDGLVAHLYGLTEEEFRRVLSTFPLVEPSIKDAALAAYERFALASDDLALSELIAQGETTRVEFKEAACWNATRNYKDPMMKDNIVQAVAAFMNSRDGGILLIGVRNDRTVVGLADDYKAANEQRHDRDSYQLFLQGILNNGLSLKGAQTLFYSISFGTLGGKDVCRVDVKPADEPVFVKNGPLYDFYIRDGNGKRKLNMLDAFAYRKLRWG